MKGFQQKVKGKLEQMQGEVNQHTNKGGKGGMQKVKGKIDEIAGDVKMKVNEEKLKNEEYDKNDY